MTTPAPGTTVVVDIAVGDIDTRLVPDVALAVSSNLDTQPPVRHNLQGFRIPTPLVVEGLPRAEPPYGARIASRATLGAYTKVTAPLDPKTLQVGSWCRWLPYAEYLSSPANGGRRWWPQQFNGSRLNTDPRMSLYSIDPKSSTGKGLYGPLSPGIDEGYRYSGYSRLMARPAMVFDGLAAARIDPEGVYASMTMAMVVVLHPSPLPYYGLFEADVAVHNEPLVYRYTHGRLDVFSNETRVVSHETHKPAHYPVILVVSLDSTTKRGRLLCLDQSRTTRTFNLADLDFVSMLGLVGALGQGTTASPWRFGSEMDLLELNLWREALTFPAMESAANLLSMAYGVAG